MASNQFEEKEVVVFSQMDGMDTQADRHDLEITKAAWMENLQPISSNRLLVVPGVATPLTTISTETIVKKYYFNFGNTADYVIEFCASGAAYATTNPGGVTTQFAPPGTFSTTPDCTQLGTQRILIADSIAGYCTWDTVVFVKYGGVSPNITVTAGGSGYTNPTATISGGSGSGAAASVQSTGGVITGVTLTAAGTGYVAGDSLTISFGGGGMGATATVHVWPNLTNNPTTLAVFQGRVWLAYKNIITYTGTGSSYGGVGYDDFIAGDASGSFTINEADLVHSVTALRAYNNYLFIFGDNSVRQIGNISVSGSTTSFTVVVLSSDQGTVFRDSIVSYDRIVLFANYVGVFAVYGASVTKVSDEMDGIFKLIDFTQLPCSAVANINNIHCFLLLVKYQDPTGSRSIMLSYMNKKWFIISQGNNVTFITTGIVNSTTETFATSGHDVTPILSQATSAVNIKLSTSLTSQGKPFIGKRTIRYAISQSISSANNLTLTFESERTSDAEAYSASSGIQFVNNSGNAINFIGADGNPLIFFGTATFFYKTGNTRGISGNYIGATLTGTVTGYSFNNLMIEYGLTAAFTSTAVDFGVTT